MTDKERLKEISNLLERYYSTEDSFEQTDLAIEIIQGHVEWLIKQAEKKEYWMKQHRKRCNELEDAYFKIQLIENQNKRYKQALEFYAERDNYQWEVSYRPQQEIDCMVIDDSGHTARQALKGETK